MILCKTTISLLKKIKNIDLVSNNGVAITLSNLACLRRLPEHPDTTYIPFVKCSIKYKLFKTQFYIIIF